MPRGNGLGPAGYGPMTGRGMGYCAGYDVPGFMNGGYGGARGGRFGRGRGYGPGLGMAWRGAPGYGAAQPPVYPSYSREGETADLKNHAEYLKERLNEVESRLRELEDGGGE